MWFYPCLDLGHFGELGDRSNPAEAITNRLDCDGLRDMMAVPDVTPSNLSVFLISSKKLPMR